VADRINIPSTLTIEQIRGIEKFQATLAAAASNAFKNVRVDDLTKFNANVFNEMTSSTEKLGKSLIRLQGIGGGKNKLFKSIFGGGLAALELKNSVTQIRQVEAALRKVGRVALEGDSGKLKSVIGKYVGIFEGIDFKSLVAERLADTVNDQVRLIQTAEKQITSTKVKEAKSYEKTAAAAQVALNKQRAIEQARLADLQAAENEKKANARRNRGLPEFLERNEFQQKNRDQLAERQRQLLSDNAAQKRGEQLSTERIVRANIAADESRTELERKTLIRQNIELDKEESRVKQQQLALQHEINKAEAAGISRNNSTLQQARKFTQQNPREIAMLRGAGQGAKSPIESQKNPFGQQYFTNVRNAVSELGKVKRAYENSAFSARRFGENTALAFKRYSAFVLGTFAFQKLSSLFYSGIEQTKEFDKNLTKLRQVTGGTKDDMENLGRAIFASAKDTGTGINDISEGLLVFAQAGYDSVEQLKSVTKILADLPLTPSFDDVKSTAEGLVAVFGQFGLGLTDTVSILDRFNYVAKETAIESRDLIEAASKSGSAFTSAGADLNKFIELTTLLRSKTRESAAVVSTFFRTTLVKLQSNKSQDFLESIFGSDIRNLTVIQQLDVLADKYAKLSSQQKNNLLSPLVDVRQLARFGKLLEEINSEAIKKGQGQTTVFDLIARSAGSVEKDAQAAGDNVATSFNRIAAAFADMIETLSRDSTIKKLVKDLADLAVGFSDVVKNGKVLIAVLAGLGAAWALPRVKEFGSGFLGSFKNRGIVNRIAMNNGISAQQAFSILEDRAGSEGALASLARRQRNPLALGARYTRRFGIGALAARAGLGSTALSALGIGGLIAGSGALNVGGDRPSAGQNLFNGALQGAGIGAGLGSLIGPWGAAIGGLTGATIGLMRAMEANTKAQIEKQADEFTKQINAGDPTSFLRAIAGAGSPTVIPGRTVFDRRLGESVTTETRTVSNPNGIANFIKASPQNADNFAKLIRAEEDKIIKNIARGGDQDLTKVRDQAIKNLFGKISGGTGGGDNAIRKVLADLTSQGKLGTLSDLEKRVKTGRVDQRNEDTSNFFDKLGFSLDRTVQSLRDFDEQLGKIDISSQFAKVITNFTDLIKPNLTSNNRQLLDQSGFGRIFNIRDALTQNLSKILSNKNFTDAVKNGLSKNFASGEDTSQIATIGTFIENLGDDATKAIAEPVLAAVQGLLGPESTLNDVLQFLDKIGNNAGAAADELTRVKDVGDSVANVLRAQAEAVAAELEVRSRLAASLLQMDDAIKQASDGIRNFKDASEDRRIEGSRFNLLSGGSGVDTQRERAAAFLRRANTSSGDFTGALEFAQKQLIRDQNRAAQSSGNPTQQAFNLERKAQESASAFNRVQQLFNQSLEDLQYRIDNAASATDSLREVFTTLKSTVIEAGQSVRQMTKKDFAIALSDLRKFGKATGGSTGSAALNKGFAALGPGGLDRVTGLFSTIGDFNIKGTNLTGNQINDKINSSFGGPAIAAALTAFTGKNVSSKDIESQLLQSFQAQRDASKLETQLREQMVRSLDVQKNVMIEQKKALLDQTVVLQMIADQGIGALNGIKNQVDKLFGDAAQKVAIVDSQMRPISAPDIPSMTSNRFEQMAAANKMEHSVAVEPMLVNVKVFSDGILEILGPEIQKNIEEAISSKLSEVFADEPDKASKLQSSKPRLDNPNMSYGGY